MSDYLTVSEVAALAPITAFTIRYHIQTGKVKGIKRAVDGRYLIPRDEAARLIARKPYTRGVPVIS